MSDASQDAHALRHAMKGFGTDDSALVSIICSKTNEQLQAIRYAFSKELGRDLVEDIKSETSGHYEMALVGLVLTRAEFDARCCNKAMKGMGTDEAALIETLAHRDEYEYEAIKAAYLQMYGKTLEHDIKGDCSGTFQKMLLGFINNKRTDCTDPAWLEQVCNSLYDAGQGRLGTDEQAFINVLTTMSQNGLRALNDLYANRHGDSLVRAVDKEMGGNLGKALDALLMPHDEYYADLIFKAVDGAGTNDDLLVRVVCSRRHLLHGINKVFIHKYQKSLHGRISSECSGNLGKVLAAVTANI